MQYPFCHCTAYDILSASVCAYVNCNNYYLYESLLSPFAIDLISSSLYMLPVMVG